MSMPASDGPGSEGAAAEAIRAAEAALAQQNSVTAQVDLAVVTAVLNAHTAHSDRAGALDSLQREIESAVATRTALDTAAGAREFQRYLIDKLGDIRTVVEEADLDDTSKASLAAALASLYASAGSGGSAAETSGNPPPSPSSPMFPSPSPGRVTAPPPDPSSPAVIDSGLDPGLSDFGPLPSSLPPSLPSPLPFPDPEPAFAPLSDATGTPPSPAAPLAGQPAPVAPTLPSVPALPSLGGGPSGISPWDGLGSLPALAGLADPTDEPPGDAADVADEEVPEPGDSEEQRARSLADEPLPPFAGVIASAVAGTPIAEAFNHQGITIPGPGTPVSAPLAPEDVVPGDVALFDDRHALALGNGKVLLDDQIQPIDTVARPGFIGWQHPPQPDRIADSER
ncbi:MAG: DUF4226 domain-containing protein [Mycobacterium sp.]|nr:DUF4226 domain-containing protein [Mycobacterium sp.]